MASGHRTSRPDEVYVYAGEECVGKRNYVVDVKYVSVHKPIENKTVATTSANKPRALTNKRAKPRTKAQILVKLIKSAWYDIISDRKSIKDKIWGLSLNSYRFLRKNPRNIVMVNKSSKENILAIKGSYPEHLYEQLRYLPAREIKGLMEVEEDGYYIYYQKTTLPLLAPVQDTFLFIESMFRFMKKAGYIPTPSRICQEVKHGFKEPERRPPTPPVQQDVFKEVHGEGKGKFSRNIDNSKTFNVSGPSDKKVQELPSLVPNEYKPNMGYRFRPKWEQFKDSVPFLYWEKYEPLDVEADLYGVLRLEAVFQRRSHSLVLQLKQKAHRYLQQRDLRLYTRVQQYEMVTRAVTMAMLVDPLEERCVALIKRNTSAMTQHGKFWGSMKVPE
nr:MAG: RNA-dependent RNA polymerase [Riboviria sp.]